MIPQSTIKPRTKGRFRVGDRARFKHIWRGAIAEIVEDRGPIGAGGRYYYHRFSKKLVQIGAHSCVLEVGTHRPTGEGHMDPRTNEELLQAYYDGDDNAFRVLWSRLFDRAYRLAQMCIRPYPGIDREALATDAANDAFLAVNKTRYKLESRWSQKKGKVWPWLARIVRNCVINRLRREGSGAQTNVDNLDVAIAENAGDELLEALTLSHAAFSEVDSLARSSSGVSFKASHQRKPGGQPTPRRS